MKSATASGSRRRVIVEEILGAVFGSITLWYLVSSIVGLA